MGGPPHLSGRFLRAGIRLSNLLQTFRAGGCAVAGSGTMCNDFATHGAIRSRFRIQYGVLSKSTPKTQARPLHTGNHWRVQLLLETNRVIRPICGDIVLTKSARRADIEGSTGTRFGGNFEHRSTAADWTLNLIDSHGFLFLKGRRLHPSRWTMPSAEHGTQGSHLTSMITSLR